jgi:hypothetical protein
VLPVAATGGKNELIVGAAVAGVTVKETGLVTDELPVFTTMGPLVAPAGMSMTSSVAVADTTVAATPFTVTLSEERFVEKPEPTIVSVFPGAPWGVERSEIESVAVGSDAIDTRFPDAS